MTGTLKAFDPLVNLVLFGAVETLRSTFAHHLPTSPLPPFFIKTSLPLPSSGKDPEDDTTTTRDLGVIVCRGTSVTLVCPEEGLEQIDNPFEEPEDDEEEDEEAEEGGDGTAAAAGDAAADA